MSFLDERDELPAAPPPDSFVEVQPMEDGESAPLHTEPDAAPAPVLDLVHLARARRMIGEAEMYSAAGLHDVAIVKARDAEHAIKVALEKRDRAAFVSSLAEGVAAE